MAIKHDFRILIETEKKKRFSYMSASIFNSDIDTNYTVSSSDFWKRITGSRSCSYQNSFTFDGDTTAFSESSSFKDNIYLSSSLNGGEESGSIRFHYTGVQKENGVQDKILRFKIFGSGVCTSLSLVENFWYRPEDILLKSGSPNYFRGDVDANSLTVLNNFNVAGAGSVTTHFPFRINKDDSKFIKFVNVSGSRPDNNDVYFGYNHETDRYILTGSFRSGETAKFDIGGVNEIQANSLNVTHFTSSYQTSSVKQIFTEITSSGNSQFGDADTDSHTFNGHITCSGQISASGNLIGNRFVLGAAEEELILSQTSIGGLSVSSGMSIDGKITASGIISSSATLYGTSVGVDLDIKHNNDGDTKIRFTDDNISLSAGGTDQFNINSTGVVVTGHITASGNVSASGDDNNFGKVVSLNGEDARLKIKSTAGDKPGLEWYDGANRKWITYSDGDSGGHELKWKNASDVDIMELDQDGQLHASGDISASHIYVGKNIHLPPGEEIYFNRGTTNDDFISWASDYLQ